MDDVTALLERNDRFIEAFRQGSWPMLQPILSDAFSYLAGDTGEVWSRERYIANLHGKPAPDLKIDQIAVHVDGNVAVVSARSHRGSGRVSRYVDTYERRGDHWLCVHACVWPVVSA
jgi:hypothetical protein